MKYVIPDGTFTQDRFAKLNGIKHRKSAWRILNRYVETGKIRFVRIDNRRKVYRVNDNQFVPRSIFSRQYVCPPRDVNYIFRLMGVYGEGGGGGSPS